MATNTISVLERRLTEFYGTSPLSSATIPHFLKSAGQVPSQPIPEEPLQLAEVYWADLPRNAIAGGDFRFADTHQWVRTILARLYRDASFQEYKQAETYLDYLLSSLVQLQRFTKLPEKLGIVQFDADKVVGSFLSQVEDFVGDTQFITHPGIFRTELLARFEDAFRRSSESARVARDIHIIAHGHGAVMTVAVLLHALSELPRYPWVQHVRGLWTVGSSLEADLLLFPERWEGLHPPRADLPSIEWRDYRDFGDAFSYSLDHVREWLQERQWDRVFSLTEYEFARYPSPLGANRAYWADSGLFAHIIGHIDASQRQPSSRPTNRALPPPASRVAAFYVSYLVHYGFIWMVLWTAVAVLYTPSTQALGDPARSGSVTVLEVSWLATILFGITAITRIAIFSRSMATMFAATPIMAFAIAILPWSVRIPPIISHVFSIRHLQIALALAACVFCVIARRRRSPRSWALLLTGIVAVVAITVLVVASPGNTSLWSVLLGGILFVQLWSVAIILFDLTVVWHLFVRSGGAIRAVREMRARSSLRRRLEDESVRL
jgi:hypothetical protein